MDTKSAARTLDIFEAFSLSKRPMTLTELAKQLDSPVSSCFQLVKTMERRGFIFSLGSRRGLYPTKRMLHMMEQISHHDPLKLIFQSALSTLQDTTRETAVLAQQVEDKVIILDAQESLEMVRYSPQIGTFHELHSTAVGKALLGAMEPADRAKLLDSLILERFTETTLNREKLEEELERSADRGWHVTRGENNPDLCAVAAPVSINGQVFALGLGGPFHRFITEIDRHAQALTSIIGELETLD